MALGAVESPAYEAQIVALAQEHNLLPREQEVLKWLGAGLSNADIAIKLNLSANTVRSRYVSDIFIKMKCQSRSEILSIIIERLVNTLTNLNLGGD